MNLRVKLSENTLRDTAKVTVYFINICLPQRAFAKIVNSNYYADFFLEFIRYYSMFFTKQKFSGRTDVI